MVLLEVILEVSALVQLSKLSLLETESISCGVKDPRVHLGAGHTGVQTQGLSGQLAGS